MVTIYALRDPTTRAIRYVGKTTQELSDRLKHHVYTAVRRDSADHRSCWVRRVISAGGRPLIETLEACTDDNWQDRERYWIAELRRQGADLTNSVEGGVGVHMPSAETRARMRAAKVGRPPHNKGKTTPPEARARQRAAALRRWDRPGERAAHSARQKGRPGHCRPAGWHHTPEAKAKIGYHSKLHARTAAMKKTHNENPQ